MHGEFCGASARRHRLRDAADVGDVDSALDLLLVDVDNSVVSDRDHALLRPLELIDFLNHCGINKSVCTAAVQGD
mgnify:FL=1